MVSDAIENVEKTGSAPKGLKFFESIPKGTFAIGSGMVIGAIT